MTREAQRIAIATACGWTPCYKGCNGKTWRLPDDSGCVQNIPNYLNDLNACHEMEKVLTDAKWTVYREHLRTVVLGGIRLVSEWCKADLHATAARKCEAFLRAMELWEEAQ